MSDAQKQSKLVKDILSRQAEQEAGSRTDDAGDDAKAVADEAKGTSSGIKLGSRLKKCKETFE